MSAPTEKIFDPSQLCQIGIVVKSIDEALKYYREKFGMGPFEIRHVDYPTASYYGEVAGYRGKRAFFHLGPIQIELIELVAPNSLRASRSAVFYLHPRKRMIYNKRWDLDDFVLPELIRQTGVPALVGTAAGFQLSE